MNELYLVEFSPDFHFLPRERLASVWEGVKRPLINQSGGPCFLPLWMKGCFVLFFVYFNTIGRHILADLFFGVFFFACF